MTSDAFKRDYYAHRRRLIGGFYAYDFGNETTHVGPAELCAGSTDAYGLLHCEVPAPASGNLILRPLKHYRFTVGAEFIYGWQALKDSSVGRANRVQVSLQYNLYRKPGDPDQQ